ncbi:YqhA family protein [Oceanicella actignis]|uniref:YqhA family protein n=1 Tax=Oceanicella actignis TaxID=1189325 RepID=UPI0011E75A79|nr:YqhA family protein [Oceanicella actignis]TYO89578.1 putative membrane protein YqhA [Oceanicella actignis]
MDAPKQPPIPAERPETLARRVELAVEHGLWGARLLTFLAVLASLAASIAMYYITIVDAGLLFHHVLSYGDPAKLAAERAELRAETITHVVEVVDGFLLATVLLIFALGLYELFISPLDPARGSRFYSKVLVIRDLDDLKSRLGKVVVMILIVKLFESGLDMKLTTPLDLLTFAGAVALIGVALYVSHSHALPGAHRDSERGH